MYKYALITTTINIPYNLEAYVADIALHNKDEAIVIVAGDKKTPVEAGKYCHHLSEDYDVKVLYLSPEDQDNCSHRYSKSLGWNTVQRRNMAILYAYHSGAEIIVTIDDDNLLNSEKYLSKHGALGETQLIETVGSDNGWYNVCRRLTCCNTYGEFYPRGYSVDYRGFEANKRWLKGAMEAQRVVVNGGLWLGDPDIDAVTRIAINPKVDNALASQIALARKTYCPFNSQNTALHRNVIPAYCMVSGVGRFDDIIPSFFVKKIADHLEDAISFGEPIVRQERNPHNVWKDLDLERTGMELTDRIVEWLRQASLTKDTYAGCIEELIEGFYKRWCKDGSLQSPHQTDFMNNIVKSYQAWRQVI